MAFLFPVSVLALAGLCLWADEEMLALGISTAFALFLIATW